MDNTIHVRPGHLVAGDIKKKDYMSRAHVRGQFERRSRLVEVYFAFSCLSDRKDDSQLEILKENFITIKSTQTIIYHKY